MRFVYALIVLIISSGCSSVGKISDHTVRVSELATASKHKFETIREEAQKTKFIDVPLIVTTATQGISEQEEIIEGTKVILGEIPKIEDAIPWWATMINYIMIATSIIGIFVLLWYLGLGTPIKALMRRFSLTISSDKKSVAKLIQEAQDPNSKTSINEAIAVMRATDKEFDAAYRKEKKK